MKLVRRRFLGATLALGAPRVRAAQVRELRVVYFQSFPPFSSGSGSEVGGLFIDVLNEALGKRRGVQLKHIGLPWIRAQEMVEQGEADAFVTIVTPERGTYTNAGSIPVHTGVNYAYAAADHPRLSALRAVRNVAGFVPYTLATYNGNNLAKTPAFAMLHISYVGTAEGSVEMALSHRVDLVPGDAAQVRHYLRKLGAAPDALVQLDPVLAKNAYSLQIRKGYDHPELLAECDTALREMRVDGTLDAIIARYK